MLRVSFYILSFLIAEKLMASPLSWNDFTIDQHYQLAQKLEWETNLVLLPDESFRLEEISELEMIKVRLLRFAWEACPDSSLVTDLNLANAPENEESNSVGVQVKDCTLEVFIEYKDLNTKSLFVNF